MSDTWIAVPTYWGYPEGEEGEERTVFDHPTPLNTEGTLARTLESFRKLDHAFRVVIVLGASHDTLFEAAHDRVAGIARRFADDFPVYLVSPRNLGALNGCTSEAPLKLDTYGNIRNVQLAVPYAAGCRCVIGIDDDEVIEDPAFIGKVHRFLGRESEGEIVGGMAGPYFDAAGEYRIRGAESLADLPNIFLKKNYFMNEALKKAMNGTPKEGISKCNVAFGGNMCESRDTISRVCHDPYIPRGEDYDYVINAKMAGVSWYFQPSMRIVHLPPDSTGSQAADSVKKLINDIKRFIYMKAKDAYHRAHFPEDAVDTDYLMPYPGPYLNPDIDLPSEARRALTEGYPQFCKHNDPDAIVDTAVNTANEKVADFFAYRKKWRTMTAELDSNPTAEAAVEGMKLELRK